MLQKVFVDFTSVEELTLGANARLDDVMRLQWKEKSTLLRHRRG